MIAYEFWWLSGGSDFKIAPHNLARIEAIDLGHETLRRRPKFLGLHNFLHRAVTF